MMRRLIPLPQPHTPKDVFHMNFHYADKIAYFFIAFSLYLLLRAFSEVHTAPPNSPNKTRC